MTEETKRDEQIDGDLERLVGWFDSRLGLSHEMLRPAPEYSLNPFYWLGALTVVAFVIQGITGMIMMLYYVPNPTDAYSSTQYIFQHVSYGRFLETVHLYTAYAMIMLAFMHLMRGYFVSVYKKPREVMWIVGMIMGFVTLGFGFTGYLLPWTVVSKSATDVGTGMLNALPQPVSNFLNFLISGPGGDTAELLRFFDLHVVVLPAVLLILLALKMYMLETHGVSEPVVESPSVEKKRNLIPIFPDVSLYLLELAALFGSAMLVISVLFPINLQPEYSAQLASTYVAQPDWYFLWLYQILKIQAFEPTGLFGSNGLTVALSIVTLLFAALFLLPFLDRSRTKKLSKRVKFLTLGVIFVAEIAVLAIWGLYTPGVAISDEQAVLVLGGTSLVIAALSAIAYRLIFSRNISNGKLSPKAAHPVAPLTRAASLWTAGSFVVMLGLGTIATGTSIGSVVQMTLTGVTYGSIGMLAISLAGLSVAVLGTMFLLYRLDLGTGSIKRRIKAFEIGWN